MIQIRKLLLTLIVLSLGSVMYGMEKEQLVFSQLPSEIRRDIASLLIEKTLGYNYHLFKKIKVEGWVTSVAFSPDSKTIIAAYDNRVSLWEVGSCKQLKELVVGINATVTSVIVSPDGKTILTGSDDKTARLWDVETGKQLKDFKGHTNSVTSVAFSPDGTLVLTGSADGTVCLWEVKTGKRLKEFLENTFIGVHSVAFSPDKKTILTGCDDNAARLWDVECSFVGVPFEFKMSKELKKFEGPLESKFSKVYSVAFNPDGKTVLTGSSDGMARLWGVESGDQLKEFIGHTKAVFSVAFSPNGKIILTGSNDHTVRLWDVESGEQLKEFKDHTKSIWSVALSNDGETIVTGSWDTCVMVYKRYKESDEETKERFEKKREATEKEYQEKIKYLLLV